MILTLPTTKWWAEVRTKTKTQERKAKPMTTNNFNFRSTHTTQQEDISKAIETLENLQNQLGLERYSDSFAGEALEGYSYECEGTCQMLDAYLTQDTKGWAIVRHSVDGYTLYNILLDEDLAVSL